MWTFIKSYIKHFLYGICFVILFSKKKKENNSSDVSEMFRGNNPSKMCAYKDLIENIGVKYLLNFYLKIQPNSKLKVLERWL